MKTFKELITENNEDFYNSDFQNSRDPKYRNLHLQLSIHYQLPKKENDESMRKYFYSDKATEMNTLLWNHHKEKTKKLQEAIKKEPKIKHIDDELASHKTPHDLTLWSGSRHDPRGWMDKNSVVHHPAYLSTTIMPSVARRFSLYNEYHVSKYAKGFNVLKIHVPKDHPGMYVGGFSHHDLEKEFLLPRGMNLKHIKTEYVKPSDKNRSIDEKHFYKIHHMEVA